MCSKLIERFLTKGSGKSHIEREVFRIMVLCKRLNITIIPIHLLRDDSRIKIADDSSKTTDTDDWQVDVETFQKCNRKYNFTVDLFASKRNAQCKKFYSNFFCSGTSGIDEFSHFWVREVAWICPPIRAVTRIIRRCCVLPTKNEKKGVFETANVFRELNEHVFNWICSYMQNWLRGSENIGLDVFNSSSRVVCYPALSVVHQKRRMGTWHSPTSWRYGGFV